MQYFIRKFSLILKLLSKWHFTASSFYFLLQGLPFAIAKDNVWLALERIPFRTSKWFTKESSLRLQKPSLTFLHVTFERWLIPHEADLETGRAAREDLAAAGRPALYVQEKVGNGQQPNDCRLTDQDWAGRQARPLHEPLRHCAERGPYFLPVHTSIIDVLPGVTEPTKDPSNRTPLYVPQK